MADGIHTGLGVGTGLDKPYHDGICQRIESVEGLKMQIEGIKVKDLKPYDVCRNLDLLLEDGELTENTSLSLQRLMAGSIAMQLFGILDSQDE